MGGTQDGVGSSWLRTLWGVKGGKLRTLWGVKGGKLRTLWGVKGGKSVSDDIAGGLACWLCVIFFFFLGGGGWGVETLCQTFCAFLAWVNGVFVQRHFERTTGGCEVCCMVYKHDTHVPAHCLQVSVAASDGSAGRVTALCWHNSRGLDLRRGEDMLAIQE